MLRKILTEDDEELDENTYIYECEFFYDSEQDIENISLSDLNEKDDEMNLIYESDPIYDTDGEEEFSDEINFVVGDEIVEVIAERKSFVSEDAIGREINSVGEDVIIEEVVFVEKQKSSQDITTSRANDFKGHKFSGSYNFYEHNSFSKDLKEDKSIGFVDQEGLFVFYLHVRFKVWEIFALLKLGNDYFLQGESHHKYVINVMKKCGGGLYLIESDYNLICYDLADYYPTDYDPIGHDLVVADLTNEFVGVCSFVYQKHQEKLFLGDCRISYPPKDLIEGKNTARRISTSYYWEVELVLHNNVQNVILGWSSEPLVVWCNNHKQFINMVVLNCLDWFEVVTEGCLFCGYIKAKSEEKGWPTILELEDWSPLNAFEGCFVSHDVTHVVASSLLFYFSLANKFHEGSWKFCIGLITPVIYDGDPDLRHGDYITNLFCCLFDVNERQDGVIKDDLERNTFGPNSDLKKENIADSPLSTKNSSKGLMGSYTSPATLEVCLLRFGSLNDCYGGNAEFGEWCGKDTNGENGKFLVLDGFLLKWNQFGVPKRVRELLALEAYCGGLDDHFCMLKILKEHLVESKILGETNNITGKCVTCLMAGILFKPSLHTPLPMFIHLWEDLFIDFIVGWPQPQRDDANMVADLHFKVLVHKDVDAKLKPMMKLHQQVHDYVEPWIFMDDNYGVFGTFKVREFVPTFGDDDLPELRSIPFEEGGYDTITDRDKGWFDLNDSWVVFGVLFFSYIALMIYTTMIYLIDFSTCYVIQGLYKMTWCQYLELKHDWAIGLVMFDLRLSSQINTNFMMMHGCMVYGCMATWSMADVDSNGIELMIATWNDDMAGGEVAKFVYMVAWELGEGLWMHKGLEDSRMIRIQKQRSTKMMSWH